MVLWDTIVGALLKTVAPKVADYYTARLELKHQYKNKKLEGKIALEQRKIDLANNAEQRDHEWEVLQIQNSGWKDEWVLLIVSIPLILSFIPGGEVIVANGFESLSGTPDWYMWLVLCIYAAVYGIRVWRRESKHVPKA